MPQTHVHFILDNSGSMYKERLYHLTGMPRSPLLPTLPETLSTLAEEFKAKGVSTAFTVFSDSAVSGEDIKELLAREVPRTTNIAVGFSAMLQSQRKDAEHVVVVLISDGDDSNGREGLLQRKALPPLPMPSTLLTIAVGRSFPTTTVLNDLYGKFHTSEDKSHPLVLHIDPFAQDRAETLVWIKGQPAIGICGGDSLWGGQEAAYSG